MLEMLLAEIEKEEALTPEMAQWPNKFPEMFIKTFSDGAREITVDPANGRFALHQINQITLERSAENLWNNPAYKKERDRMITFWEYLMRKKYRRLLFAS